MTAPCEMLSTVAFSLTYDRAMGNCTRRHNPSHHLALSLSLSFFLSHFVIGKHDGMVCLTALRHTRRGMRKTRAKVRLLQHSLMNRRCPYGRQVGAAFRCEVAVLGSLYPMLWRLHIHARDIIATSPPTNTKAIALAMPQVLVLLE